VAAVISFNDERLHFNAWISRANLVLGLIEDSMMRECLAFGIAALRIRRQDRHIGGFFHKIDHKCHP
jgi:hypothetical protein